MTTLSEQVLYVLWNMVRVAQQNDASTVTCVVGRGSRKGSWRVKITNPKTRKDVVVDNLHEHALVLLANQGFVKAITKTDYLLLPPAFQYHASVEEKCLKGC